MIRLELSHEEQLLLEEVLDACVSDLHSEIVHTDLLDLRDALKHRRDVLQHVADALKQREPSDAALRFFACTY